MDETNRYAEQCLQQTARPKARILKWTPTNSKEIEQLLGVVIWMGLCSLPTIQSYWRKHKLYSTAISTVMSRNRFQLLLRTLHFCNNEEVTEDRLRKLTPLLNRLRETFQSVITPSEYICIDETLVPFRGRLSFRQYISNKRHKFGIKLFKLCLKDGYTFDFQVYCGKSKDANTMVPSKVVMDMMENLLDKGRTLCTDNYYTSVSLACSLLQRKTHLIGTLRTNRKFNPKQVIEKKLKIGESIAQECKQGIVVQKWKDKRDVLMLSTRYGGEMITMQKRGKEKQKPKNVLEYNKYKAYIDLSDQLKSYNTALRRSVKWYRKLAFELLTGTAIVNAHIAFREITNNRMSITEFKEKIVEGLLNTEEDDQSVQEENQPEHRLEDVTRANRRRCVVCYQKITAESGRAFASRRTPQTTLKCTACDKFFCLECFFDMHKAKKI